ncbi:MAG: DNA polymerase, partial [Patescibacteria group bacterium]
MKKLMIVDGNSLIHRGFHAIPHLSTSKGVPTNGVFGFVSIFLNAIKLIQPDYVAVAFDLPGPTFRDKLYPEYKAKRVAAPQELYDQIPKVKEFVRALNLPVFEKSGYEADDIIGTIVKQVVGHSSRERSENNTTPSSGPPAGGPPSPAIPSPVPPAGGTSSPEMGEENVEGSVLGEGNNVKSIIVTGDLDSLQLVDEDTSVFTTKKGLSEIVEYDPAAVRARYGFGPEHVVDFKALRGDPSDNIPGVKGIGEKGAADLIKKFGRVEEMYRELESDSKKAKTLSEKLRALLLEQKKQCLLSKKLATIETSTPIKFHLAETQFGNYQAADIIKFLQEVEFKSLLDRIPRPSKTSSAGAIASAREDKRGQHYHLIKTQKELDELVEKLEAQEGFVIDTETTSQKEMQARLLGISVSFKKGEAYYVPINSSQPPLLKRGGVEESASPLFQRGEGGELNISGLVKILQAKKIQKYGHNMKYDFLVLNLAGIDLQPLAFDTMIGAYLLNPGSRGYSLDALAFSRFGYQMQPIEDLISKGKSQIDLSQVPLEKVSWYSCEDADFTGQLKRVLEPEIKKEKLDKIFYEIDLPLVRVLALMEKNGILLDSRVLARLSKKVERDLGELETKIHKMGQGEFNINSPQQLKEVLFVKLRISTADIKKTKTGLSTAASELEKMRDAHPIIPLIVEYRELSKLKNTYLDALPALVDENTGRIHTSYNQTIAATGRLSSTDPNLQNIPIRTELGNKIREAFVAGSGKQLLSLDYSQ